VMMSVWRDADRFLTQLPGQPAVEVFPESEQDFFAKVVDAQITFHADGAGPVTDLVLHQNGKDQTATRMDEAVAKQRADALALKIKNQTPSPGTESELRRHITELIAGTPDFGRMGPELTEATRQALPQIQSLLRQRHRIQPGDEDDFNIRRPDEILQARVETSRTLSALLVAVASIALVVGGIGVMNVMLVSVAERTREIGLRLAVGAADAAVQLQFLGEAVMLALFGGLSGVVLGAAGCAAIGAALGWSVSVPLEALAFAPAISIAVGIFFGFYPARKAAQLNPIDALRYE